MVPQVTIPYLVRLPDSQNTGREAKSRVGNPIDLDLLLGTFLAPLRTLQVQPYENILVP